MLRARSVEHETEAATCFQRALDIARRQEAKSLELRAAMSLSRFWQQQGKRDEARELLVPIYGGLAEGFNTADLQEARALLAALFAPGNACAGVAMVPSGMRSIAMDYRRARR
jgi:predicted ATPase